jgi:hypothetical protein
MRSEQQPRRMGRRVAFLCELDLEDERPRRASRRLQATVAKLSKEEGPIFMGAFLRRRLKTERAELRVTDLILKDLRKYNRRPAVQGGRVPVHDPAEILLLRAERVHLIEVFEEELRKMEQLGG